MEDLLYYLKAFASQNNITLLEAIELRKVRMLEMLVEQGGE